MRAPKGLKFRKYDHNAAGWYHSQSSWRKFPFRSKVIMLKYHFNGTVWVLKQRNVIVRTLYTDVLTSVIAIPIAEMYNSFLIVVTLANDGVAADVHNMTAPTTMVDTLADKLTPVFKKIASLYNSTTFIPLSCCQKTMAQEIINALMLPRLANSSQTPDFCFFASSTEF